MEHEKLSVSHAIRNVRMLTGTYISLVEAKADPNDKECQEMLCVARQIDNRLRTIQEAIENHDAEL